jgi:hypothetical protein
MELMKSKKLQLPWILLSLSLSLFGFRVDDQILILLSKWFHWGRACHKDPEREDVKLLHSCRNSRLCNYGVVVEQCLL